MILKPIPPKKYDGSADAEAFTRCVTESNMYLDMGRVPPKHQVLMISYHLEGRARDFYNQKVVSSNKIWSLSEFFNGLFEFAFPKDFRIKQRRLLSRTFQNDKRVAAHVALFLQIFNTIGLADDQEKVVKLWHSFRTDIQQEMYRKELDPEISTWDEV
ncbi:hypothetical protein B0H19DRAFT_941462, partial [Mycena capillaripes]